MIDLTSVNYITVQVQANTIDEGTTVYKPNGSCPYELCFSPGKDGTVYNNSGKYGKRSTMVYLRHSNGNYYAYPAHYPLKVTVYKLDLQKDIDDSCEY